MQTPKPIFDTLCISNTYPSIKGSCEVGTIDVYDDQFNLVKSINVENKKFYINLDDLTFKTLFIKNTGIGYTISDNSNILIKCNEALPCIKKAICNYKLKSQCH